MIEYDNDDETMTMTCDARGCIEDVELEGSFQDCVDQAKQLGWKIKNVDGEWLHFCPDDARDN